MLLASRHCQRWLGRALQTQGSPTLPFYQAKVDGFVNMVSYRCFAAYSLIGASLIALNTTSPIAQDSTGNTITAHTASTFNNEKPSNLSAPPSVEVFARLPKCFSRFRNLSRVCKADRYGTGVSQYLLRIRRLRLSLRRDPSLGWQNQRLPSKHSSRR